MGSTSVKQNGVRTFGPFTFDPDSGELSRNQHRIRLQPQPALVLALLTDQPGKLILREEIYRTVWGEDTHVDFEQSLNYCIRQIRSALRDDANEPKYLETVPKRGYRFLASVEIPSGNGSRGTAVKAASEAPAGVLDTRDETVVAKGRGWIRFKSLLVSALVLAVFCVALAVWLNRRSHALQLGASDTIILADFANSTGDAIFDDTLQTALAVSLRQSPFLNPLSAGKIARYEQAMTLPPGAKLTPPVARDLCQRAGGKAYIAGSIGSLGSDYVLGLKAVNCESGDTLAQELVKVESKEKVLDELGGAATRMRRELGESLASVQKFNVPLAEATTSSLEALKAFTRGLNIRAEKGEIASLPYFQRSVELDPNFAMGYRSLGGIYLTLEEDVRGEGYVAKAYQLRGRASEPERLTIVADYYSYVTGELDRAAEVFRGNIEIYPKADGAYVDLFATLMGLGKYEEAIAVAQQASRLEPESGFWYEDLAAADIASGQIDQAQRDMRESMIRKRDSFMLHQDIYSLAFLKHDSATMAEQLQWFAGKPDYENYGLGLASDAQAYGGHFRKARDLAKLAAESAVRTDNKENAAGYLSNSALQEAAFGERQEARKNAAEALKLATNRGVEAEAALAFAMADDTPRAAALATDLAKRFPLDTQIQALWLPAIQTRLALDRKNPVPPSDSLHAGDPIEFGYLPFGTTTGLYWLYVRGEAYLAAGNGVAAAAEFQKILDHSWLVLNCWTGALARLGVARAKALQSRTAQGPDANAARVLALAAYKDFLALWNDADPDIPILKEAKVEYAKLEQVKNAATSEANQTQRVASQ
jgi:DNA-binding winged helix-turn-helix (wHTH) protein/tetratricopeptide (TPR) repeat protein